MKNYKLLSFFIAIHFIAKDAPAQITTKQIEINSSNAFEIARSPFHTPNIGMIATNTPSFERYAYTLMLKEANELREKWTLDIPKPLEFKDVFILIKAEMYGFNGGIGTRDKRFEWQYIDGIMVRFIDKRYYSVSFQYKDEESARLEKIPSKIDFKQAEAIARDYLKRLGLSIKKLGLIEPALGYQYKFQETDGTVYPLPCFHVTWRSAFDTNREPVEFDISGITKQVAEYCNYTELRPHHGMPTNLPPNYFEMLGVKPPSTQAQLLGHKPLDPITIGSSSTNGR